MCVALFLVVAERKACGTFDSPLLFSKVAKAAPNLEDSFPGFGFGRIVVAIFGAGIVVVFVLSSSERV